MAGALSKLAWALLAVATTTVAACGQGAQAVTTGSFNRVIAVPGKRVVPCPPQDESTAVLLVFGQSNSANHAERAHQSRHRGAVVNFFDGRCYEAGSPLLGAEGTMGESFTLLGDKLVDTGVFEKVVLVSTGIGGTGIRRWQQGGDLNGMLMAVVDGVRQHYRFTHLLWHQGESDAEHTSSGDYTRSFHSMLSSLRQHGVTAPVYVSVTSWCDLEDWKAANPVADAQRALVDLAQGIHAGVDTDALIPRAERYDDCHFGATGQERFAAAWRDILSRQAGH